LYSSEKLDSPVKPGNDRKCGRGVTEESNLPTDPSKTQDLRVGIYRAQYSGHILRKLRTRPSKTQDLQADICQLRIEQ
jgi:hypothetical protein